MPSEPLTLVELEAILGPSDEFIVTNETRPYLSQWALAVGIPPMEVYSMGAAKLSNLYHERGRKIKDEATELQRIAADIFVRLHQTIQANKIDPEFMRAVIREEIEQLTPRRLEIVSPTHTTIINAPTHYKTDTIIKMAALGHNVMMVGPAGCGKTTIGKHVSMALQFPFYITSTINDTHELTGFVNGAGHYHRTAFRDAFEHGGVWVADEIDAWDASALLATNAALANGYSVFPDSPHPIMRHPNFRALAAANTFGNGADRIYIGRNELDAASLDRFGVVPVDYDLNLERLFCLGNIEWLEYVWRVRKAIAASKVRAVASSRAIINGAAALSVGMSRAEVEEFYLFKGMSEANRAKLDLDVKPSGAIGDDDVPF